MHALVGLALFYLVGRGMSGHARQLKEIEDRIHREALARVDLEERILALEAMLNLEGNP